MGKLVVNYTGYQRRNAHRNQVTLKRQTIYGRDGCILCGAEEPLPDNWIPPRFMHDKDPSFVKRERDRTRTIPFLDLTGLYYD